MPIHKPAPTPTPRREILPRVDTQYLSQDQGMSGGTRNRKPKSKQMCLIISDIDSDFIYNMDHMRNSRPS